MNSFKEFINYCNLYIKGDEKGEAQKFLDHFFMALGYKDGSSEAGAVGKRRIFKITNDKRSTSFADLVWEGRVLIEMKKRGEDLSKHLEQVKSYWIDLTPKPQYVILCNFDEFWIYDFNKKVYEPLDQIKLKELENRHAAFNFLKPTRTTPVFANNWVEVTKEAAKNVARVYQNLLKQKIDKAIALNFCMQCVLAMFAEDTELLPESIFTKIIDDCELKPEDSFDLISGLFRQMNSPGITTAGKYKGVDYFNGGLFEKIDPIELKFTDILSLKSAAHQDWSKINPAIFGSIFENGMDKEQRHEFGAHYTHESDIKMIVYPCIVNPWLRKIEAAKSVDDYYKLLRELRNYKVFDPACGSGNFLFVAFREMKILEKKLLDLLRDKEKNGKRFSKFYATESFVSIKQFYGIDKNPYAVELAKVTLMVAKELLLNKEYADNEHPLPLDNLNENIICADALFTTWTDADVIIGNPPFQSKTKMQQEFGKEYINKLRVTFPDVPGRADFCVYWFYKAIKQTKPNHYSGLIGTNTITQNYSREGGLDKIATNNCEIIEAVQTMPWQGEAAVHVSIANWKKGKYENGKTLFTYEKDKLIPHKVANINSSLSLQTDVASAKVLECNKNPKKCFQGQTHGHEGFLLSIKEAKNILKTDKKNKEVLKPFLIGDELVGNFQSQPKRFVIDFSKMELVKASSYKEPFKILEKTVLPEREEKAFEQEKENKKILSKNKKANVNKHHINFYKKWWNLSWGREDMIDAITDLKRYVACARVTQRLIFEFLSKDIRPNDKVMVFAFEDDYSFGIIQSAIHWKWFTSKATTLGSGYNYNTDSIWNTFPWPQNPTQKQIEKVAKASKALRDARNGAMKDYHYSFRDLYRVLEKGNHKINDLQKELDNAVMDAYNFDVLAKKEMIEAKIKKQNLKNKEDGSDQTQSMSEEFPQPHLYLNKLDSTIDELHEPEISYQKNKKSEELPIDILEKLLALNLQIYEKEKNGEKVQAPGLPDFIKNKAKFVSDDCVKFEE